MTFSRNGITSSMPSGPPNETTTIASNACSGNRAVARSAGCLRSSTGVATTGMVPPCRTGPTPHWLASATAWIDEQVERTGEIEQPHIRPWATVLRVPTGDGTLWFKANVPALAHELPVIEVLASRFPAAVPELVALDEANNWMLLRDGGEQLREVIERERKLEHWLDVLPIYAELQIAAAADVDQLIARGAPDRGLADSGNPASRAARTGRQPDRLGADLLSEPGAARGRALRATRVGRHRGDDPARRPARQQRSDP